MNLINQFMSLPNSAKLLVAIAILFVIVSVFRSNTRFFEGYEQNDKFLFKEGIVDIYDSFYADIYDFIVFNNMKNDYEVGAIINQTKPNEKSVILDIGSGTGHHVAALSSQNLDVIGIDISPSMVKKAKENYPKYDFKVADALDGSSFPMSSFTHILCLYFTIYYMKDKTLFFRNCMDWLMPGGALIIHLVDKHKFDPIVPPANPLYIVSPQKYAKERITKAKVTFNEFVYTSNFQTPEGQTTANFEEKFKFNNGKVRKQEHKLYMESIDEIINYAKDAGFIVKGKVDLINCAYEYQYLYIFQKPSSF